MGEIRFNQKKVVVGVLAVVFVLTMFFAANCFAEEKEYYIPTWIEELYGTWINEAYTNSSKKLILYDWGYCEAFEQTRGYNPEDAMDDGYRRQVDR